MKTIYKKLLFLLLLMPFSVFAQSTLEGTVVDKASKQPLPGVNVVIQGSSAGTQTDFDGNFKISGKQGDKVVFSYLGYKNSVVNFSSQKGLMVSLEEESNQLQEVVVQVGYGSVKKKDATGSVELITSKDFNKGAITSVDGLLNGRASGVVVTSSGTPGNGATIRIRGGSSLLASNDPLIVIDGLPIDGGLSSVNPNDIETFSILKDASSTAIYGNRGSNGVILITTKKGSKKGLEVSLNTFTSFNTLAKEIDVFSTDQFRGIILSKAPERAALLGNANTDWQKQIFKNSYTSDVSVSVLGNLFNKMPSRLTIGNTDNNGVLMTSQFKRTTASFALSPTLWNDHLKFNLTGTYAYTFRRNADEGAIGSAISMNPTQPVYDAASPFAGYFETVNASGTPNGTSNPVALLLERRNVSDAKRFFGNFNMEYKFHFLPELRAVLNLGIDKEEGTGTDRTNPNSRSGYRGDLPATFTTEERRIGYFGETWYDNRNENLNVQLNYTKKIGKLNLDVLAAYDWQQFDYQNFTSGNIFLYGYGNQKLWTALGKNEFEGIRDIYTDPGNNLQAYLGRVNLGYNDKYLLTFNFRRDGSTRISPINKWENFYGGAFAWKIKEESFLKNSTVFSDLKLRLGYGQVGQQALPNPYAWIKRYNISNNAYYQFGDQFYLVARPENYNENLKWEKSTKYNVGLDFGFFNNRLRGSVDGYFAETTDLFSTTVLGALQGLGIFGPRNVGSLESKGVDVAFNVDAVKHDNFDLSFNYNVSYNKVTITDLFSDNLTAGSLGLNVNVQSQKIGETPYSFFVYEQIYDANGRPIQGAYVDRDGNGVIDSKDKYLHHKPTPDVTMGFLTNATIFKNFEFSMAWRASIGNYVFDRVSADRATFSGINNTVSNTVSNSTVDYGNTNFTANVQESDYYVKDGSFVKLDNVTFGYNFRDLLRLEKMNLRFTAGVQNVLTITKYKGLDPEVFNNGIDNTIFPRARMFTLGVNANF
jgi:TonB-linked SusC/RagA family outer membrane protein